MKKWFGCYLKASLWLAIYIGIQSIVAIVVFLIKIYTDYNFLEGYAIAIFPFFDENYNVINSRGLLEISMKYLSGITTSTLLISGLIITLVILIYVKCSKVDLIRYSCTSDYLKYLGYGCFANLIIGVIIELLPAGLVQTHDVMTSYIFGDNLFAILLSTGVLAPFVEEFVFRYAVQKNMSKINVKFAIVFQALLFGSLHSNLVQILYAFVLGIILGIIYNTTKDLAKCIIFHCGVNVSSILAARYFDNSNTSIGVMAMFVFMLFLCEKYWNISEKVTH